MMSVCVCVYVCTSTILHMDVGVYICVLTFPWISATTVVPWENNTDKHKNLQ